MIRNFKLKVCALLVSSLAWATSSWSQGPQVDFARDIKPIFDAHCTRCHGVQKAAAQLRLDDRTSALRGGISGAVIIPGNSKGSILLARLTGTDGQAKMPLSSEALKPEQIALIQKWIEQGAVWPESERQLVANLSSAPPQHWAYKKAVRPAVPKVKNSAWVRNPIDSFVLARLEKEGLEPSPEASKETLFEVLFSSMYSSAPVLLLRM